MIHVTARSRASAVSARIAVAPALALSFVLSACGGSGGLSSTPTPAPAPVPTPTPTPTNTSLPATLSETFTAASAKTIATIGNATGAASDVSPSRSSYGTLSVAYDAAANSYTIADEAASRTFTSADTRTSDGAFEYYTQVEGTTTNELKLFRSGASNQTLALTYVSYANWSNEIRGTQTTRQLARYAVFGVPTTTATMPRTGTATYAGVADGTAIVGGQAYSLLGSTGTVSADFATGVVRTTLALSGSDPVSNSAGSTALGTLTGVGAVSTGTSRYTGTISGLGSNVSGSFGGGFFGPGAAETGLSFSALGDPSQGNNDSAVGVFVGKR